MAELRVVDGLRQERLDPVLDDWLCQDLVHIWPQTLIGIDQRAHKTLHLATERARQRIKGPPHDLHGEEVQAGRIKGWLLSTHLIEHDSK